VKALEKVLFNHVRESPRTWGTRPGGKTWWQAGKAVDKKTTNAKQSEIRDTTYCFSTPEAAGKWSSSRLDPRNQKTKWAGNLKPVRQAG
jgi:hypothetical protein